MLRLRLAGERGVARARATVDGFRPLRDATSSEPRVLLSGFGPFPNAPRNATAEIMRGLGVPLRRRDPRALELATGRGRVRLPSGLYALVSVMVLPVVWEAAALLVTKEAAAFRPAVILMSGVAAPAQPLTIERAASRVRSASPDAWGVRPTRRVPFSKATPLPLRFELAEAAARGAIQREVGCAPALGEVLQGVAPGMGRAENAYVCNATTHDVVWLLGRSSRVLRCGRDPEGVVVRATRLRAVECGFLHWPRDVVGAAHVAACARVLLDVVDALVSPA